MEVTDDVPPGAYWTGVIPRWATLRITDVEGRGAASLLAFNARQPSERYNAPDTTKVQNGIFLTTGWLLFSDLGRVLLSITADTCGHHETLAGGSTAETVRARFGDDGTYLRLHNERHTNARDNFIAAVGRHGLDERDLVPNVNLFSRVEVAEDGALRYVPAVSTPGASVDLRAEMDVLVALSATPHVLDPSPNWEPGPLRVTVQVSRRPAEDDLCRTRTAEAVRAFDNTDGYWSQVTA
ncbi:MAG: urea amidolyase associated protein UAAP1 [Acidimicrobiales bacterium]